MRQTTLCVPLEVKPESCSRLSALVEEFRRREDTGAIGDTDNFARIKRGIPVLHFMSMSVFTARDYDPIFIIEANFDGAPGPFWGQVEALYREELRAMLRCCKRPLNEDGALYDAVTAPDAKVSVVAYLEARTQQPSVFHHGNRGLSRDRIWQERDLFLALRDELDAPGASRYRGISGPEVHAALRDTMKARFPWLAEPGPERITGAEGRMDKAKFLGFVIVVLLALTLPGILLAALMPARAYVALVLVVAAILVAGILRMRDPLPGTGVPTRFRFWTFILGKGPILAAIAGAYVVGLTILLLVVAFLGSHVLSWVGAGPPIDMAQAFRPLLRVVALGQLSLLAVLPGLVFWLRYLERRDSSHDAPPVDERLLREMIRREDWVAQNHMGSIVLIKPGVLRSIVIRAGHLGLGLLLRVTATDGYLGSMRTVHFAHWAFLNNGSRLLFFSNFDHSWDSYLDDFIEKAHVGLTLAWGCGVGFPPTRFLIYDGASHGRRFKNWALSSRAVSRFWYSAYPKLTVDQIERNHRIANGLRSRRLSTREAEQWMADL